MRSGHQICTQQPQFGVWGYPTCEIWMGTLVFPGVPTMASCSLCATHTGTGGGGAFPMLKMKRKNTLHPILGSENTFLMGALRMPSQYTTS